MTPQRWILILSMFALAVSGAVLWDAMRSKPGTVADLERKVTEQREAGTPVGATETDTLLTVSGSEDHGGKPGGSVTFQTTPKDTGPDYTALATRSGPLPAGQIQPTITLTNPSSDTLMVFSNPTAKTWLTIGPYDKNEQGGMAPPRYILIGELPDTFEIRLSATEMVTLGELRRMIKERR